MIQGRVEFRVEGQKLVGTLCLPKGKGPFPAVLFFHGRGSSQKRYIDYARRLAREAGIVAFCFDFRGHGGSEGDLDKLLIKASLKDAQAGFDFLKRQRQVDSERLGISGTSWGGYLAAIIASQNSGVKSLILRAPAVYKAEWKGAPLSSFPVEELKKLVAVGDVDSFKAIRKFKGSLLVICQEYDEVVPRVVTDAYYKNATSARKRKLYMLKGATHRITDLRLIKEVQNLAIDWFRKTL